MITDEQIMEALAKEMNGNEVALSFPRYGPARRVLAGWVMERAPVECSAFWESGLASRIRG